eukprot:Phypoly_transcript_15445.p1 GENE.Phypoly_transcript_15445~~Phypoly_transcript_15445.p1  ORF type:complete len:256 (+),score=40.90 Phypoly_transcript_15445:117-884(+)
MEDDGDDDPQLQAALALSLSQGEQNTIPSTNSTQPSTNTNSTSSTEPTTQTTEPIKNTIEPAKDTTLSIKPQNTAQYTTNTIQPTPNETHLAALKAMGFPEVECGKALIATNNIGVEAATAWLLRNTFSLFGPPPTRIKMVLVVRTDLRMGVGKIAAQCGHAAVGIYKDLMHSKQPKDRDLLRQWENCASPKIALKVESYDAMMQLETKAATLNLATHVVLDAGKTQVAPGSATVLSIMGPADVVDQVTGSLKLL